MRDFDRFLATAQAFTTAAVSENTWDVDAAGKNLGNAQLYMHLMVNTTYTGLASGATILAVDSAAEALSGDRAIGIFTSTNCSDAGVIPVGDLTAGTHLIMALPPGIANLQYIGAAWLPASEAGASGDVDIWIDSVAGEVDLQ